MYKDDPLYQKNANELFISYLPHLKKINSSFSKNWVKRMEIYQEDYAQPIVKTNYHQNIFDYKMENEELYICSMAQIYPEDRGMNHAIRLGLEVSKLIIDSDNNIK